MPTATLLTMRRPRPREQVEKARQVLLGVLLALVLVLVLSLGVLVVMTSVWLLL